MDLRNRRFLAKMIPAMIMALLIGGSALTFAMIDETNSVHIDAGEIEDSTLIIGSHLIYLGAMTDQIYEIAMDTAEEANQYKRYYKSELAGGVWYDITEAGLLADITTEGTVVQDSEIEALNMTHHTKSDGLTYDLRTNASICIFDINDPYQLDGLKELEPIKLQYDTMAQTAEPSETNKRDMLLIEEVYKKDRENEKTKAYDEGLKGLQSYYEILIQDGAEAEMSDRVMKVMEKVDYARRAEVLQPLNDGELEMLNRVASREYTYMEGEVTGVTDIKEVLGKKALQRAQAAAEQAVLGIEDPEQAKAAAEEAREAALEEAMTAGREELDPFTLNTDLITAVGEAMSKVQESYINCSSNMLAEGTTVLSQVEYALSTELIDLARAQNFAGCDAVVQKLIYLDRINNGVIRQEDAEREFIDAEVFLRAENMYRSALFAGEGEAYRSLSSMAAAATKANVLKQQKAETETKRNELQFIIQAYIDRMASETAIEHIAKRIDDIGIFRSGIKTDAYAEYAHASVDAHLEWLKQTMKNLQDAQGGRTMDRFMEQKQDLQTERMTALDNNQLGLAKKLDAEIEAIDKEIQELEQHLSNILNSENTSDSEKAKAAAQLGEGSAAATLQKMKTDALQDIHDGNLEGIENIIDGIGAMAELLPENALDALQEVYEELSNEKLTGSDAADALLKQIEEEAAEQMENFIEDLSEKDLKELMESFLKDVLGSSAEEALQNALGAGDGSGTENGTGDGSNADGADFNTLLSGASEEKAAILLAGLSMYAEETGSDTAEDTLLDAVKIAFSDGNRYVFEQLKSDPSFAYAPTDRIAKITKYRYIFNDSQKAVTLQQDSQYYKFKAFSEVSEKGGTFDDMTKAAGFQGVIYLPGDAAENYFALQTAYLYHTKYGLLLTAEMQEQAIAFFDHLLEAGGEF